MKQVYKITYPNGKIYIGKDLTGRIYYFGSASSRLIALDFPEAEKGEFLVRKEILWQAEDASDKEVSDREIQLIRQLRSNDPAIGYNRWPKCKANRGSCDSSVGRSAAL